MRYLQILIVFMLCNSWLNAQISSNNNLEGKVLIDGLFNEWDAFPIYPDGEYDAESHDIKLLRYYTDSSYLYLYLELDRPLDLFDDNSLKLYIDSDHDPNTGVSINKAGAEWKIDFDQKKLLDLTDPEFELKLSALPFEALPTYTSNRFEFSIPIDRLYNDKKLIQGQMFGIQLVFDQIYGDLFPDQEMELMLEVYPTSPAVNLEYKLDIDEEEFRITTFNILHDGLIKEDRKQGIAEVVEYLNPDIIGFNEGWKTTEAEASKFMSSLFPNETWSVKKLSGNLTCSKYPIKNSWDVLEKSRLLACLIQINDSVELLHVNAHLSCCAKDDRRLEQVNTLMVFIDSLKQVGILHEKTPIVISGDMNLVGLSQQYEVLINGNPKVSRPDLDQSPLSEVYPYQVNGRSAITWRDSNSSYPPGKLDYIFFSDSNLKLSRSFVLESANLTESQVKEMNPLKINSSSSSDHLPVTADFRLDFKK